MTSIAGQFACEECQDDVAAVWAFDQGLCKECAAKLAALHERQSRLSAAKDPATGQ